jgi:RNA polymerase sigma-70 factor (ECF subfamily)
VRAWLFTTARNLAIDAWRRRSTRVGEVVTDALPEPPPTVDEAERAVEAWTIAEALSRLTPSHREVLVECFYRGRSVTEAAARLGVPPGTVKSRTHYALRSLRLVLAEMGVTK